MEPSTRAGTPISPTSGEPLGPALDGPRPLGPSVPPCTSVVREVGRYSTWISTTSGSGPEATFDFPFVAVRREDDGFLGYGVPPALPHEPASPPFIVGDTKLMFVIDTGDVLVGRHVRIRPVSADITSRELDGQVCTRRFGEYRECFYGTWSERDGDGPISWSWLDGHAALHRTRSSDGIHDTEEARIVPTHDCGPLER